MDRLCWIAADPEVQNHLPSACIALEKRPVDDRADFSTGVAVARILRHTANWETGEWDFTKESNEAIPGHPELFGLDRDAFDPEHRSQICRAYWERHVSALKQAWAIEIGIISYDRILLCGELGDHYHEGPHLLVEYLDGQPFEGFMRWIEPNEPYMGHRIWKPEDSKRLSFFPTPIPDEREQWYEQMRKTSQERQSKGRA